MEQILPYVVSVLGFFAVYTLNGIKSEIKELKTTVKALEADMRGGVGGLDRRVTVLETRCSDIRCGEHK